MYVRFALGVAIAGVVSTGLAADQVQWTTPSKDVVTLQMDKPEVKTSDKFDPQKLGLVSRASRLPGLRVKDEDHRTLGRVKDLVVDLKAGRALGCIVQRGDDFVFVPANAFFPVSEDRIVITDQNRRYFEQASPFKWNSGETIAASDVANALRVFGGTQTEIGTPVVASTIFGRQVKSGNRPVAQVQDIVADVPRGDLVYVVLTPTRGSGVLYAVPPQKLQDDGQQLTMIVEEQHFLAGPKTQREFWTEMAMPRFASAVYRHYGLLGEAGGAQLTPTGRTDNDLRNAFLSRLVNDAEMAAADSDDLHVTTKDGRLVLRGTVKSESAHRKILSAAEAAAGAGKVVDELKVR